MFYTVQAVGLLLGFCDKTVIAKLKAGEFGHGVVNVGSEERPDYRVPASGVNGYVASRRVFSEVEPISARTPGELRRKAACPDAPTL
jgi:hypothetical protein